MISHVSSLPGARVFGEQDKHLLGQIIPYALAHMDRKSMCMGPIDITY